MIKALNFNQLVSIFIPTESRAHCLPVRSKSVLNEKGLIKSKFFAALLILNVGLLLAYILGVNSNAAIGYEIKQMQKELVAITQENRKLNLQVSESSSIATIQGSLSQMDFVPAGTPQFIEIEAPQTALR